MTSRGISMVGNNKNIQFNGSTSIERCPYSDCGHAFNPITNGIYDSVDGVPILVKDLSGLNLSESAVKKLRRTKFEGINNEDVLLEKARYIDISLYEIITKWLNKGIALVAILLSLTTFSSKLDQNHNQLKIIKTNSIALPDSVIRSFEQSISRSTISKTRSLENFNTDSLKNLNSGLNSKKN